MYIYIYIHICKCLQCNFVAGPEKQICKASWIWTTKELGKGEGKGVWKVFFCFWFCFLVPNVCPYSFVCGFGEGMENSRNDEI